MRVPLEATQDDSKAFFRAMGRTAAFPGLQILEVYYTNMTTPESQTAAAKYLREALAGGALATLQRLELVLKIGSGDFNSLVQRIVASTCAATLRYLSVPTGRVERREALRTLGEAIGSGQLPKLVELNLRGNSLTDAALKAFVSSLTGTPALEVLRFDDCAGITDKGVAKLAKALRRAKLGARLRELRLGCETEEGITDDAAKALAEAIEKGGQYVTKLEVLHLQGDQLTDGGREELVQAVTDNCLSIKEVLLAGNDVDYCHKRYLNEIIMKGSGRKRGVVQFSEGYEEHWAECGRSDEEGPAGSSADEADFDPGY